MHPVYTKTTFGRTGALIKFYNGTKLADGYVVRQIGVTKFVVTDGSTTNGVLNTWTVSLAQTAAQVSALGSSAPTLGAFLLNSQAASGSGATFTPTYSFDASTSTVVSGGAGFATNDVLVIDGGTRASGTITIAVNPTSSDTITLNGTLITPGTDFTIGPNAGASRDNLYTFLTGSANAQLVKCWYVKTGTTGIMLISQTVGTTMNAFTLATSSPAKWTLSGSTLAGGTAAVAGTPTQVQVTNTGGVVTGFGTINAAGAWTTLPSGTVTGYYAGNGRLPVTVSMRFQVASIAASGGSGYSAGQTLTFSGMTDTLAPQAHIATLSGSAPATVTVDTAGSGISVAASSIGVAGSVEHVKVLYDTQAVTVENPTRRTFWALGKSVAGSAILEKFA